MAGDKREVRVAVVGDAAQLQRELQKAEGHLSGFGNNAQKAGSILQSALFGGAVLYGAKKLVDAAGDLQQSIGGTAAVFEDASGAVNDFTKNSADLVGMSENAARTITSRLGASLKGFGMSTEEAAAQAINLTKTGADLAATLGGKTDDAVAALGSALRGEYDPLERFGIALKASEVNAKAVSMGLADSETNVTAFAKGQATLALITERSAFAQGQFGREADTAQGQAQRAQAKTADAAADLGKSLLPVYTKIQETIGLTADAFSALPGPVQTGVVALTGIVLIGPKLVQGFTLAASAAKTAATAILDVAAKAISTQSAVASMNITTGASGAAATAAAGGASLLGPAVLAVGAAAVIGGLAYKSYADEQAAVKKDIDAIIPTFNELTGAITANTQTTVGAILQSKNQIDNLNKAGISVAQFSDVLNDNRDALVSQTDAEYASAQMIDGKLTPLGKELTKSIRERGGAQNELIARLLETGAADDGLIKTLYNGIDAYHKQQEVVRQLNIQKGISAGKSESQATAEADLAAASLTASEALEKQLKVTIDLRDAQISEEEALIKNRKALQEYTTSLGNGSLTADERAQAELDLEKTYRGSVEAAVDAAEAQAILEGKTLTAGEGAAIQSQKYKELAGTLAPDSPLRKRLEDLSVQLFLLSLNQPEVRIRLETEQAMAKFRQFLTDLGIPEGGQVGLGEILQYSGRASGGPVDAGLPYIVGEKGPELFVPSGYGRIMDAFSTSKALLSNTGGSMGSSGQAINITINTVAGDPIAIETIVVDALSRANRRGVTGLTP